MDHNGRANVTPLAMTNLTSLLLGGKLQAYNQFVLENQDEIYTFVYMLLQDEYRASLIVQRCFEKLYHQQLSGNKKTLRKRLYSLSIAAIRELSAMEKRFFLKQQKSGDCSRLRLSQDNIALLVSSLPLEQSLVISLIDIIGMNYEEAAEILVQPINTIARNLACARYSLCTNYSFMK
jgi:DNA-directed RNA polymerase specialized sigma24 family protein